MASFRSYAFQRSSSVHCSSHSRCCGLLRLPLSVYEKDMTPFFLQHGTDGGSALQPCSFFQFRLYLRQVLLDGFAPHKGVPASSAFQLCSVDVYRFVVCFAHVLQFLYKLIEQIFHHFPAAARAETCKCRVIRCLLILQQPSEVNPILTGFFQLPAGIDPAQISMDHDLEQHPWIRCRFSPSGRIRFVQFPVLQFLKLRA